MSELLRRIRFLFHRAEYERELDEEMQHHLAMLEADGRGVAGARRQFGNVTSVKEDSRSMWTFAVFEQFAQDIRYAARMMAANPLFTATAVLSLALGIGANTAIYSFLDAILLRGLAVPQAEQLAIVEWQSAKRPTVVRGLNGTSRRYGEHGTRSPNFPYGWYESLQRDKGPFSAVFGYTYSRDFTVNPGQQAEAVQGGFVSGSYFNGLGVAPAAGRLFGDEDDRTGAPPYVVLAHSYWEQRFNSDPGVVGRSLLINNLPFTVVGVSAPGFFGLDPGSAPKFFLPIHVMTLLTPKPEEEARHRFLDEHFYWVEMMGRLRPGMQIEQAQAVLRDRFRAYTAGTAQTPNDAEVLPELTLTEGASGLDSLRQEYSKPLYVLMTMVCLILAIACANLANLLLARAAARRREVAVRLSLGAGCWRIVRQMLTESVLLALTGGALGLGVAYWGIRFITWLIANGRADYTLHAELNWPVLGFTCALAVVAGILFGLAPALQATKVDFTPALKDSPLQGWRASGRNWRPRLGQVLIVGQIAVSLLLVIGAGLFVRTLFNLHSIDVGFNRENLLLVNINGRQGGYRDAALARVYAGLLDKFREIPGVRSASASDYPLVSNYVNDSGVKIPGREGQRDVSNMLSVDPAFLETMDIPVISGRGLQTGDLAQPAVAVVNQKFAQAFFANENPVGRQFGIGGRETRMVQIVGMVKTVHYNSLTEEAQPVMYMPYTFDLGGLGQMCFTMRTVGPPLQIVGEVRRIVREASTSVPIGQISTQDQRIERTIQQERTFAQLGSCFAALALVIACIGLYGAMSYSVARRTGEIGIRMALGAQRQSIMRMVLRDVLVMTAVGLAIGYGGARLTTRFVEGFLYGVKGNDVVAVGGAIAVLLMGAMAAGYLPAWRASRIDPARALRNE